MKRLLAIWVIASAGVFGACSKAPSRATDEVPMYPAVVGEKTDLYEVIAPNALKLASGVRFKTVDGPCGKNSAFAIMRQNGETGGFMACGCIGATTGSCVTTSDNPDHPACEGGCTDSEGNARGCSLFGPIIGPPRDPLKIRFLAAR